MALNLHMGSIVCITQMTVTKKNGDAVTMLHSCCWLPVSNVWMSFSSIMFNHYVTSRAMFTYEHVPPWREGGGRWGCLCIAVIRSSSCRCSFCMTKGLMPAGRPCSSQCYCMGLLRQAKPAYASPLHTLLGPTSLTSAPATPMPSTQAKLLHS